MPYRKILLIDDDEDDQEIFLLAMRKLSARASCTCESDATEALKKLAAKQLNPDVIFLDLNMPVMNGQQFLARVKSQAEFRHIPVIIFSTSGVQSTMQAVKELGAQDFITKPGDLDTLVDILAPLIGT